MQRCAEPLAMCRWSALTKLQPRHLLELDVLSLCYGKPPGEAQLQAGAFRVGITTRCQCLKPLLHPQQAPKLGKKGSKRWNKTDVASA